MADPGLAFHEVQVFLQVGAARRLPEGKPELHERQALGPPWRALSRGLRHPVQTRRGL